jgi:aryl-alcohol dehydrogenase-like predicted oxidoreductase
LVARGDIDLNMEYRTLGKTNLSVSQIGFGAGPIGFLGTEQKQVELVLDSLLDAGVNFVDTAASYPGSEEALGKALAQRRPNVVLVSKCGQSFPDLPGGAWSAQVVAATVERALKRLRTDYLDVMLLHSCSLEVLKQGEALGALVKARQAGKIRFVGYSGDNDAAVYAARHPEVAVIETSINLCDQANLSTVLPVAREHNIGVIVKRPIANGAWRPAKDFHGIYQGYAQPYRERFAAMRITPQELGFSSADDWPEIALRFTLSQPGAHVAIIGTTNPLNARRNLEFAARGPLTKSALEQLASAFARGQASVNQAWPGLT